MTSTTSSPAPAMPTSARAIRVQAYGTADVMQLETITPGAPAAGSVLVKVAAAGVNFIDVYKRSGVYPLALPSGLGEEGAGTVVSVGDEVQDVAPGDRVAWAGSLGSYAEIVEVPAARVVPVPDGVPLPQAAAVMLQGMTAHYLATSTFPLQEGHRCLVHAAAGGVGLLLVQLAKARGAFVIGTAGTAEKAALARAAGADAVILYREQDFVAETHRLTEDRGVDVIYDSVGKTTFLPGLDALARCGMMVLFGASSGAVEPIDPQVLNRKGSLFLTRPTMYDYTATREALTSRARALFDMMTKGTLDVRVGAQYALADAASAHRALEGRETTGKVLLIP